MSDSSTARDPRPLAARDTEGLETGSVDPHAEILVHDLGNIVMAMAASVDQLAEVLPVSDPRYPEALPDRLDMACSLLAAVDRSARLAGRLLEELRARVATPPAHRGQTVDLVRLACEAVEAMRGLAGDRLELSVVTDEPRLLARADEDAMARSLLNVMINAVESMPPPRRGSLRLRVARDRDWAVVEVVDDGPGMDDDELRRVLRRGVSGKGSTGLGLTSCEEALEAAGGKLEIASIRGFGTAVSLRLPAVEEGGFRRPPAAPSPPSPAGRPRSTRAFDGRFRRGPGPG